MSFPRHDSTTTRLGVRTHFDGWRLWVEDTGFARLGRNDFAPGTAFQVRRRPGTGLVIDKALLGSCHISSHKRAALLSYEARDLRDFFGTPEVRVRIHVGQVVVTPLLRFHSIARPATEHWTIAGGTLRTPAGVCDIRTVSPVTLIHTAASIDAVLDEMNLVFATELIGNLRPGRVVVHGEPVLLTVAGQFLRAGGYSETANAGEFVR